MNSKQYLDEQSELVKRKQSEDRVVLVQLLPNYLLLVYVLLLRLLRLTQRHQLCISSSTAHNWEAVKGHNMITAQAQQRRWEQTKILFWTRGYKFFLFFLLAMTWPPSVLIFFFWSPFPESPTKRFLLRSLRDHSGAQVAAQMSDLNEALLWFFPTISSRFCVGPVGHLRHPSGPGRLRRPAAQRQWPRHWGSTLNQSQSKRVEFILTAQLIFGWFWKNASPSLWLKVFGLVRDVIFLVFSRLPAPLVFGPFFAICLLPSFPSNHGREHPLVGEWIMTFYET